MIEFFDELRLPERTTSSNWIEDRIATFRVVTVTDAEQRVPDGDQSQFVLLGKRLVRPESFRRGTLAALSTPPTTSDHPRVDRRRHIPTGRDPNNPIAIARCARRELPKLRNFRKMNLFEKHDPATPLPETPESSESSESSESNSTSCYFQSVRRAADSGVYRSHPGSGPPGHERFSRLSKCWWNEPLLVVQLPYASRERVPETRRTRLLEGSSQQSRGALPLADGVVKIDGLKHDELIGRIRVQTVRVHDLGALVVPVCDGEHGIGEAQVFAWISSPTCSSVVSTVCLPASRAASASSTRSNSSSTRTRGTRIATIVGVEFDGPLDIGQCVCVAGGLEVCVCAER